MCSLTRSDKKLKQRNTPKKVLGIQSAKVPSGLVGEPAPLHAGKKALRNQGDNRHNKKQLIDNRMETG